MFLNSGFSYKNLKGSYKIEKQSQTAEDFLYVFGKKIDERMIIAEYEDGYCTVGTNNDMYYDESPALLFAGIDIHNDKDIIEFCNKYGLLFSNSIDEEETNDYLFEGGAKETSMKPTQLIGGACIEVYAFQREVVVMNKVLHLREAINKRDYCSILSILAWFCFDGSEGYDDEELIPAYESLRFNQSFREFDDYCEDEYGQEATDTLSKRIRLFLNRIQEDYDKRWAPENIHGIRTSTIEYHDMYHCVWQKLHDVFSRLLERVEIVEIDPLGSVSYNKPINEEDLMYIIGDGNDAILLGKAYLSDFFSDRLFYVHPDMTFEDGAFRPNLRIKSLIEALYVELFFKITPYTNIRKCANPTCTRFFEVMADNSRKMYCSQSCGLVMAKRKQREREKQKNTPKKETE